MPSCVKFNSLRQIRLNMYFMQLRTVLNNLFSLNELLRLVNHKHRLTFGNNVHLT